MGDLTPLFLKKLLSSLYLTLYFREIKLFPPLIYTEGAELQPHGSQALKMYRFRVLKESGAEIQDLEAYIRKQYLWLFQHGVYSSRKAIF